MTFSADGLRTGGGSVSAGRACGLPAVWSASRSLTTLLRAQRSPLVSHPPTSSLTRVPGAAPCRRVGCRGFGRGVSVGLPFGVPLRGCLGRLTIFGFDLGLPGTGNIFFHVILALSRMVFTPTPHAFVILGYFSGMSERPVNLFLLTWGQAVGVSFVVSLTRLAVSPRPATPGVIAVLPLAFALAFALPLARFTARSAVPTVIRLLGLGAVCRPMLLFTAVVACALEGCGRRGAASLHRSCRLRLVMAFLLPLALIAPGELLHHLGVCSLPGGITV